MPPGRKSCPPTTEKTIDYPTTRRTGKRRKTENVNVSLAADMGSPSTSVQLHRPHPPPLNPARAQESLNDDTDAAYYIYYQIVDSYGEPFNDCGVAYFPRPANPTVLNVKTAIFTNDPALLSMFPQTPIQIFRNLTAFNAGVNGRPLPSAHIISPNVGCNSNDPIIAQITTDLLNSFPIPRNQEWVYGKLLKRLQSVVIRHFKAAANDPLSRRTLSLSRFGIILWTYLKLFGPMIFRPSSPASTFVAVPTFKLPLLVDMNDCAQYLSRIPFGSLSKLIALYKTIDGPDIDELISQDSAFIQDIVYRISIAPTSQDDNFDHEHAEKYVAIFKTLFLFKASKCHRPEEQFRSHLWMPLLEIFFSNNVYLRSNPEFKMICIPGFINDYACDLSWYLNQGICDGDFAAPIFLVEVAAPKSEPGQDHKDFQKLACEMWSCALYYVGLLRHSPDCMKNVRIYGAFVSGTKIQFCVIFPIFKNTSAETSTSVGKHEDLDESNSDLKLQIEFVFQTSDEWTFDLSGKVCKPCQSNCGECCRNNSDSKVYNYPDEINILNADADLKFPIDARLSEQIDEPDSLADDYSDYHHFGLDDGLIASLIGLERMGSCIKEYAKELLNFLKKPNNLGHPMSMDAKLAKVVPQSRSSHSSNTPYKPKAQSRKNSRPNRVIENLKEETLSELEQRLKICIVGQPTHIRYDRAIYKCTDASGTNVFCLKIVIAPSSREMKIVSFVDKSKLKHVAWVFVTKTLSTEGKILFARIQESMVNPLTDDSLWRAKPYELLPHAFEYWLDGLHALIELRDNGIVHCDISPNNFMYSVNNRRWKLIDFECSRLNKHNDAVKDITFYSDSISSGVTNNQIEDLAFESSDIVNENDMDFHLEFSSHLVGTDGFIAPEILESHKTEKYPLPYSHTSDLYSMAMTAFNTILFRCTSDSCGMGLSERSKDYSISLKLERVASQCLKPSPEDRSQKSLETLIDETVDVMDEFLRLFSNRSDYQDSIAKMRYRHLVHRKLFSSVDVD